MNDPRAYMTGKRWIEAGVSPDPDAIADPATDLKALGLMRIIGGRYRGIDARRPRRRRPGGARCARPRTGCARACSTCSPTATTATRRRPRARRVLDLFAGTGALGLEALSRGAAAAAFVDQGAPALALLRRNLARLGADEAARVVSRDATRLGAQPRAAVRPRLPRPALRARASASARSPRRWPAAGSRRAALVVWEEGVNHAPPPGLTLLDSPPLWGDDDRDLPQHRAAARLRA